MTDAQQPEGRLGGPDVEDMDVDNADDVDEDTDDALFDDEDTEDQGTDDDLFDDDTDEDDTADDDTDEDDTADDDTDEDDTADDDTDEDDTDEDTEAVENGDDQAASAEYEAGDVNTILPSAKGAGTAEVRKGAGKMPVEVLEYVARALTDDPDSVVVRTEQRRGSTVLKLHVAPQDMGRVIGRRGRIAQAIRTLVGVAGARDGVQTVVDIADD
jgi:predicted RNA-binding protein YlqC (UPF0109 family)